MVQFGPACIRVAIQGRISDILIDYPQGLSVTELAKKTGIDSGKLRRVLRALATRHCFREGARFLSHLCVLLLKGYRQFARMYLPTIGYRSRSLTRLAQMSFY